MRTTAFALLAAFSFSAAAFAIDRDELVVHVKDVRNEKGSVIIALYENRDGFLRDAKHAYRTVSAPIINGAATAVFSSVPPGSYAVAAIHDENKNGKLDASKEGFGTSGNPNGSTFDESKFQVVGGANSIDVSIRYGASIEKGKTFDAGGR